MLVLASASPRRQDLLRSSDITFAVQPADIDETPLPDESPRECAERLAQEKALTVWRTRPQDVVLGADTIVVVDEMILSKPVDGGDAARMLRLLSGRVHSVITGVCVVQTSANRKMPLAGEDRPRDSAQPLTSFKVLRNENRELITASETTLVTMSELSDTDIRDYVASDEPMDKAGAYAIQGRASRWIPRIEGDYTNVVGLPVTLVYRMLSQLREG